MPGELLIGAHMSIAGGVHRAVERGVEAGCRTLQLFLKNNNRWRGKVLTEEDRALFLAARKTSGIRPILAHAGYLINLASPDRLLWRKSLEALVDEMERARFLGIPGLVVHPGAHIGAGEEAGLARVVEALGRAFDRVPAPVRIILENTAGQGSSLGWRFEHLAAILEASGDAGRIGICLDTCHLFAAGYDIRTESGYEETMSEFDRWIGTGRIDVFHVNDSVRELGSRVDRHAHIGKGRIGRETFRLLLADPRFAAVPKILETPKGKTLKEDKMNLATLRRLAKRK